MPKLLAIFLALHLSLLSLCTSKTEAHTEAPALFQRQSPSFPEFFLESSNPASKPPKTTKDSSILDLNLTTKCSNRILHLLNHILQDSTLTNLVLYSGKNINQLGDYKTCRKDKHSEYIVFSLQGLSMDLSVNIGLCGPGDCSLRDYNELKPILTSPIQELINQLAQGSGFNITVNEDNLLFVDPVNSNMENGFGVGFWISASIVLLIMGFAVCAAFINRAKVNVGPNSNVLSQGKSQGGGVLRV